MAPRPAAKNARKKPSGKVRYAIVGAGHISQFAFMPGVAHTGNSEMTAVVTGDMAKAKFLGKKYGIQHSFGYDEYDALLASGLVDAVYIALPNQMHRDYTVRALKAGIHVLLEKPIAVGEKECRDIQKAAAASKAKLMIAYRLHFEPATLEIIDHVRKGRIGKPHLFISAFGQVVPKSNHRLKYGFWDGPVADMGTYPINAARHLFGAEPVEVWACGTRALNDPANLHDTVSVTLVFPENRVAQFTVSYAMPAGNSYRIIGDKGDIVADPGFTYGSPMAYTLTVGGKAKAKKVAATDQFGGELQYFSDCIQNNRRPEPDAEEGWCDVRIIAAVERALKTGKPQNLEPYERGRRPDQSQARKLRLEKMPGKADMKNVAAPSK